MLRAFNKRDCLTCTVKKQNFLLCDLLSNFLYLSFPLPFLSSNNLHDSLYLDSLHEQQAWVTPEPSSRSWIFNKGICVYVILTSSLWIQGFHKNDPKMGQSNCSSITNLIVSFLTMETWCLKDKIWLIGRTYKNSFLQLYFLPLLPHTSLNLSRLCLAQDSRSIIYLISCILLQWSTMNLIKLTDHFHIYLSNFT